jgi:type II secretory pathway pseudopilin PulG
MSDHKPTAVAPKAFGAVGGSACPQADDTWAPAIALGTTRSTINALRTAHTTARQAQGAACSHGPVRLSLRAGSVGRRLHKKCLQNGSQSRGYKAGFMLAKRRGPESFRGFTLAKQRERFSGFTLPKQRERVSGFTLVELLVSMGVLVLLVLLFTQLLNSVAAITILGNKRMDADSEARQVFDRMALDFEQMLKRGDVDYFAKNTVAPNSVGGFMSGNDQIAFFSSAPGYYPSTVDQSPVSLVAYRVNSDQNSSSYNRLERMGKGLLWNGATPVPSLAPVVFMPLTISNTWCQATISGTPSATCTGTPDPNYEVIGPDVFRFEYYYLVTTPTSPYLAYYPCSAVGCTVNGWGQVAAIVVDIALIDPRSKVLLTNSQIATFNGNVSSTNLLVDFTPDQSQPGQLLTKWQSKLNGITTLPKQAVSGIRVYERYFYLTH